MVNGWDFLKDEALVMDPLRISYLKYQAPQHVLLWWIAVCLRTLQPHIMDLLNAGPGYFNRYEDKVTIHKERHCMYHPSIYKPLERLDKRIKADHRKTHCNLHARLLLET
jgi:hypothetical protein